MNAVSAKLTQDAIVAMNKAVIVTSRIPAKVAKAFLQGERPQLIRCTSSFSVEGRPASISPEPSAGSTPGRAMTRFSERVFLALRSLDPDL